MVGFGQVVVGPPGAGKTTFIDGMQQLLTALGRKCFVINLDFANDEIPYKVDLDVRQLITVTQAMEEFNLGPNGSLMYCMEYLEVNLDWLEHRMLRTDETTIYYLFDTPGQVELYTHHHALRQILHALIKKHNLRLTAVHLTDSVLCTEPAHFIAGLLVSLSGQLQLELPHVNLLTKIDLLKEHKEDLAFQLEYYAEVQDLRQLLESMANRQPAIIPKFISLNRAIAEIIEDFNLIGFLPLAVEDKHLMLQALKQIDTANGFALSSYWKDPLGLFKTCLGPITTSNCEAFGTLQEKFVDVEEEDDDNKKTR